MKQSKNIDQLIDAAVADGELSNEEIKSLRKKAEHDGLDPDEVELDARGRLSIFKKQQEKKAWKIVVIVMMGSLALMWLGFEIDKPSPHESEKVCIATVAKCISKNNLDKAEYYIKSYKNAGDEYLDLPSSVAENLVQAYINNDEIDKAVALSKWSSQYIGKPIYEYYMQNKEYLIAEEFLETGYNEYYEHLKRTVTCLVMTGESEKAKAFIVAKSSYFDDVNDIWKEERKHYADKSDCDKKYKPYFKETVVKNLMAIINSSNSDEK